MDNKPIQTFQQFWPYYLGQHRLPSNRLLHYCGSLGALFLLAFLISSKMWAWLPIILVVGYGPAWIGHFLIEKNRPATFSYPFWSLAADYKMLYYALTGRLKYEWPKYF